MKLEKPVDESDTATSSSLGKEVGTTMSKLVKELTSLCYIYNLDLKNLVKNHEIAAGENLSEKMNIFMAVSP